jgi:ABC-type uncharacterized transport system permease subunit
LEEGVKEVRVGGVKQFITPLKILFLANIKVLAKNKAALISGMSGPVIFWVVIVAQTFLIFDINQDAFRGLSEESFLFAFVTYQLVVSSALLFLRSVVDVRNRAFDSSLDIYLLRPQPLWFYKYFAQISLIDVVLVTISFLSFWLLVFIVPIDLLVAFKMLLLAGLVTVIRVNIPGFTQGVVFFNRTSNIHKLYQTLEGTTRVRPIEVFPQTVRFILIHLVPALVITSFVFEVVRSSDSVYLWATVLFWVFVSAFLNWFVWKKGLKRYESVG